MRKNFCWRYVRYVLYIFDKLGECYDEKDYSTTFIIEVEVPTGDKRTFTIKYAVKKQMVNSFNTIMNIR